MPAHRVVGDEARRRGAGIVDDRDRDLGFVCDFRRGGVVAAGMGDHQVGAFRRKLAQRRAHVAVTEALGRNHLEPHGLADRPGRIDALLVPAVVGALLRHQHRDRVDLLRLCAGDDCGQADRYERRQRHSVQLRCHHVFSPLWAPAQALAASARDVFELGASAIPMLCAPRRHCRRRAARSLILPLRRASTAVNSRCGRRKSG